MTINKWALIGQINRKLAKDGEKLCVSRDDMDNIVRAIKKIHELRLDFKSTAAGRCRIKCSCHAGLTSREEKPWGSRTSASAWGARRLAGSRHFGASECPSGAGVAGEGGRTFHGRASQPHRRPSPERRILFF